MKFISVILSVLVATVSMTLPAWAGGYGAIAFSTDTGYTSWAHSFPSKQGALNFVNGRCNQQASDCRSFWFVNACGAVAVGTSGGWGTSWSVSPTQAKIKAINNCSAHDYGCRVVRWQCSGVN